MNAGGVLNTCKSNEAFKTDYFGLKSFMTEWRTGEYRVGNLPHTGG